MARVPKVARWPNFNGTREKIIYFFFFISYKKFEETNCIHFNNNNIPMDIK
jgi:hypothetical protein